MSADSQIDSEFKLAELAQTLRQHLIHSPREILIAGQMLLQAKDQLGHGHFIPWLKENLQISTKTANRLMSVAIMVKQLELTDSQQAQLNQLDLSVQYELAAKSTPLAVQKRAIEALNKGQLNHSQLQAWKQQKRVKSDKGLSQTESQFDELRERMKDLNDWLSQSEPLLKIACQSLDPESRQSLEQEAQALQEMLKQITAWMRSESKPQAHSTEF